MNRIEDRYKESSLISEMLDTVELIRDFDGEAAASHAPGSERVLLTGEGSSRIFPAGQARAAALRRGSNYVPVVEGATQAAGYQLEGHHIYAASNSGRTAEVVALVESLRRTAPGTRVTAVVADGNSPLASMADSSYVLSCGREEAVAATKSVVEQALFYQAAFNAADGLGMPDSAALSGSFATVLADAIPASIVDAACRADTIYFAGWNDGVAEELTLKANEITRKKSDYLEGTYALHGIEEVMEKNDVLVLVGPRPEDESKYDEFLRKGVGLSVVSIASRTTAFPTIQVPALGEVEPYLHLAAGWNLLVEIGLGLGVDVDKPVRARKVGNEMDT